MGHKVLLVNLMADEVRNVVYEFSGFRLNPAERLLEENGRVVFLTPKAFDLLVYLVERHGRLVEKNAILTAVWPETVVEEANLAFQVSALSHTTTAILHGRRTNRHWHSRPSALVSRACS